MCVCVCVDVEDVCHLSACVSVQLFKVVSKKLALYPERGFIMGKTLHALYLCMCVVKTCESNSSQENDISSGK